MAQLGHSEDWESFDFAWEGRSRKRLRGGDDLEDDDFQRQSAFALPPCGSDSCVQIPHGVKTGHFVYLPGKVPKEGNSRVKDHIVSLK